MPKLPPLIWIIIAGIVLIAGVYGFDIVIKQKPSEEVKEPVTSPIPLPHYNEDLVPVSVNIFDKRTLKLIPRVPYTITALEGSPINRVTDDNGYFTISILKRVNVKIAFSHECYEEKTENVDLRVDPKTAKEIYLQPNGSNLDNCQTKATSRTPSSTPKSDNPLETQVNKGFDPQVKITTEKDVFAVGEPIAFEYSYSGVPDQYKTLTILVESSKPDDFVGSWKSWKYKSKSGSGEFDGQLPGTYEIRGYFTFPPRNHSIIDRRPIVVK